MTAPKNWLPILGAVLVLAGLGVFVSCKGREDKKESPNLKAYRLIDEGRTDEAIDLLERELEKDESNRQIRLTLSSAYAHKGGFRIQALLPMLKGFESFAQIKEPSRLPKGALRNVELEFSRSLFVLVKFMGQIQIYNSIPKLNAKNESFIQHALGLLEVENLTAREATYRLILQTILLRRILDKYLFGRAPKIKEGEKVKTCEVSPNKLTEATMSVGELVSDMFLDMAITRPKEKKELQKKSQAMALAIDEINTYALLLHGPDQQSKLMLNQIAEFLGLYGVMECN